MTGNGKTIRVIGDSGDPCVFIPALWGQRAVDMLRRPSAIFGKPTAEQRKLAKDRFKREEAERERVLERHKYLVATVVEPTLAALLAEHAPDPAKPADDVRYALVCRGCPVAHDDEGAYYHAAPCPTWTLISDRAGEAEVRIIKPEHSFRYRVAAVDKGQYATAGLDPVCVAQAGAEWQADLMRAVKTRLDDGASLVDALERAMSEDL